ncbi:hypothetical protein KIW84_032500 [Lathyrus oleraceus]|uniref:Reverse transcriptase zinc-binding domain-containing protein n=1 Tax=Pisum sativum TaxID=3888 RepID=A0A9D4XU23_PEA|nr:hypothetical protein KIW84_032500 [Pisum sativum]
MGERVGEVSHWDLGFNIMEIRSSLRAEQCELMQLLFEDRPNIESSETFLWSHGPLNCFSVKYCYDRLLQSGCQVTLESAPKTTLAILWHTKIPMKVKFFGWRLIINRLLTRSNLVVKGVVTNIHDKIGLEVASGLGWDIMGY